MNDIFDERGACRYLGGDEKPYAPRTLQRWRYEGHGPAFLRMGRLIRYRRADLDAFMAARSEPGLMVDSKQAGMRPATEIETTAITAVSGSAEAGALKQRGLFDYSTFSPGLAMALAKAAQDVRARIKLTPTGITSVDIGITLYWAKGQLGPSQYLAWLGTEIGIEEYAAEDFMCSALWIKDEIDTVSQIDGMIAYLLSPPSTELLDQIVQLVHGGDPVPASEIKAELLRDGSGCYVEALELIFGASRTTCPGAAPGVATATGGPSRRTRLEAGPLPAVAPLQRGK